MSAVFGVLVCLSPLLFLAAGYYLGRYGSPIALHIRGPRDRRRAAPPAAALADEDEDNSPALVVYRPFDTIERSTHSYE